MLFSHLHVHTQYSLLDGAASIKGLYQKAMRDNMPALAITDHGNMFGAFSFVAEAWDKTKVVGKDEYGNEIKEPIVKPIVGCEFYVVKNRHEKSFTKGEKDERYHQVLLAKNNTGYQNLLQLTSLGYIEGVYGKYPRIDKELILQYHEGLIATTCCIGAYVPQTILHEDEATAEKEFKWWLDIFGDDYYIELQRHNMQEQIKINDTLLKFAKKYNVKVIATNDSHYVDKEDYNAHDIMLCINTGEKQATPGFEDIVNDDLHVKNKRFKFPNDQFYFKTTQEMKNLFADIPESLDNTNEVVDKVAILNLEKDILLPAFPIPKEFEIHNTDEVIGKNIIKPNINNQWEYLKHLTYEGAKKRYGEIETSTQERIDFELFTIKTMGFAGYFLIVSDFIKEGRNMGVFIGPGRGSAAGSVVAYCIGITNIDPIKYNLLFERFLNPDRNSMPDIDTDFDDEGRQKVIDYVVKKYTKAQVAQIVTFGTMAAKSSIKDVARVMDLPLPESIALTKLVPDKPGTELKHCLNAKLTNEGYIVVKKDKEEIFTLDTEAIENIKRLREIYTLTDDDLRTKVLKEAERLEGSVRNTGIHAAGIIIAPKNLTELIPIATAKDSDLWVTQIEGSIIERAGVIKMDFLGLKTLSILKKALELIKHNHQIEIDLDNLPLDDEKTFQLYQAGATNGTFQFESPGMQKHLRDLKPDKFADLIAMNALYRPGPIAYIPNYIARKHGKEPITYDIPDMETYLAETYGITVYQEQVMLLSQQLGGFSKGDADVLRKAMGKKQKNVLDKMKAKFIEGATNKGHPKDKLEKVWTDWESFAEYAFNKSHSTCYALVAYQTAYLKAHYPSEYMSAVLNYAGSIDKITFFMEECRDMGIVVLGPDINESIKGFSPNKKGEIRFGLGGLKAVGENAIENIITERNLHGNYTNIFDFISRINQKSVNKKSLESLIYSGAFDSFTDLHRAQFFHIPDGDKTNGLEKIINYAQIKAASNEKNTNTLFGDLAEIAEIPLPKIPACEQWSLIEKLDHEKDVTGIFISGHPLDNFKFELNNYKILALKNFNEIKESNTLLQSNLNRNIRIAGLVTDAQHRLSKNGKSYGKLTIEDYSSKTEFFLWSDNYVKFQNYLEKGKTVLINGAFKVGWKENKIEFSIDNIILLETTKQMLTQTIHLTIHPELLTQDMINFLAKNIKKHRGDNAINFRIYEPYQKIEILLYNKEKNFGINDDMVHFLMSHPNIDVRIDVKNN
ncbi:MAG: DNA polymerase III subunit alpha [Chitinophagaceae bacterium]|nr:DNA polymerase III subunit alpha [Chitinophagaceae bacterium]MCW5905942.1 DNA polymerase III subunit alpha [Chitinophagaceae bacterium]